MSFLCFHSLLLLLLSFSKLTDARWHFFKVTEDFLPIISRIKATTAPFGGVRGEITYAREHKSVWFKGKRFAPSVWANTPGEEQIKQLKPSIDSKGRKVGEEWFTTVKVENALARLTFNKKKKLCFKKKGCVCYARLDKVS